MRNKILILIAAMILVTNIGTCFAFGEEETYSCTGMVSISMPLTDEEKAVKFVSDSVKKDMRLDWGILDVYSEKKTSEGFYEITVIVAGAGSRVKGVMYVEDDKIIYDFMGSKQLWHKGFFEYKSKLSPRKQNKEKKSQ